jgi:hypothetical protein
MLILSNSLESPVRVRLTSDFLKTPSRRKGFGDGQDVNWSLLIVQFASCFPDPFVARNIKVFGFVDNAAQFCYAVRVDLQGTEDSVLCLSGKRHRRRETGFLNHELIVQHFPAP